MSFLGSGFGAGRLRRQSALDESLVDRYLSLLLMRNNRGIGCANWSCKLRNQPCRPSGQPRIGRWDRADQN